MTTPSPLDAVRSDLDALDDVGERLDRAARDRDLDDLQAGLEARARLLASVGERLRSIREEMAASGDGNRHEVSEVTERLVALEARGATLLEMLAAARDGLRSELATVRAGHAMARHQSRLGTAASGGWCDVRR